MPLTIPKAASGSSTSVHRASRLGTIRFSTVLIPVRRLSARARGTAVSFSRWATGIRGPVGGRSSSRRIIRHSSVRQPPSALPSTTQAQATPGSFPARKWSRSSVSTMEQSCSATSTAARVPIFWAAVKYPVITPHRQLTGRKAASSRRASSVRISPIQLSAITGAKKVSSRATAPLHRMLYRIQPESTQVTFWDRCFPSSSAVRYMVAVRMPAIPATIAMLPTDSVSCSRPMPAAPIREERYT